MKVGVIGDTHIPDRCPLLPARITEVFQGLDIILHVGDICELGVLREFQERYTLTFAVAGEGDNAEVHGYLGERRVVSFGQRRIGMIHGHQLEEAHRGGARGLMRFFRRRPDPAAMPGFLLAQFGEEVDAIVFGHTHRPYVRTHGGVLLFNPGGAVPGRGCQPSVGILDMGKRSIAGRIAHL
ncbi:MAG: metallophosphoesterase family protein [Anaerolineae bacterium]|jgi:putative phosphoesterase